jgi:hypothetical protein
VGVPEAFSEVMVRVLQAPAVSAPVAGSVVKTSLVGPLMVMALLAADRLGLLVVAVSV